MTKWPEKKESPTGKDCNCMAHYYGECSCGADWSDNDQWNLCHDAFMKVINEQQLQPLNEKLVRNALETKHGLTDHQSMLLWHTISEFGNPKQQEVSVKEIRKILDYYNLQENGFYTDVISQAIHDRIHGKGK